MSWLESHKPAPEPAPKPGALAMVSRPTRPVDLSYGSSLAIATNR